MVLPHTAFARLFTRALEFNGRSTRSEFWWGQFMLFFALAGGMAALMSLAPLPSGDSPLPGGAFGATLLALSCGITVVTFTAQARRLHDAGYSALWLLVSMVPILGGIVLLVLLVLPSQDQANKWGPTPGDPMRPLRESPAPEAAQTAAHVAKPGRAKKPAKKASAWDSYAILANGDAPPPPQVVEARKAEVSDYYRRHILKQSDIPAE